MNPLKNDLRLNEICLRIRTIAGKLDEWQRDGKSKDLWTAFEVIQSEAMNGCFRLNDIRFEKDKHP